MSAIRKREMATVKGSTTRRNELKRLAPSPMVRLLPTPIMTKSHHAGIGIRFNQAAVV
jgi:hypothetical protein